MTEGFAALVGDESVVPPPFLAWISHYYFVTLSDRRSVDPEYALLAHVGLHNAPILPSQSKQISDLLQLATFVLCYVPSCLVFLSSEPHWRPEAVSS